MTKLNYTRPIFRYLDNLRREMRAAPSGAVPDSYGGVPITVVTRCAHPSKNPIPRLTDAEADIAFAMVEALSAYIEADSAVIKTLTSSKNKANGKSQKALTARNAAENALINACALFLTQSLRSKQLGREHLVNWYHWLHSVFEEQGETGTASAWETLNNWAMKSASERVEQLIEHACHEIRSEGSTSIAEK